MQINMCMELWWKDTDRGKQKYWRQSCFLCHFIHIKAYMDRPGIEAGAPHSEAGD
jgi:hypothetical protein